MRNIILSGDSFLLLTSEEYNNAEHLDLPEGEIEWLPGATLGSLQTWHRINNTKRDAVDGSDVWQYEYYIAL